MKLRHGKISNLPLLIVTVITVLFIILEFNSKSRGKTQYFEEKIAASELTLQSFAAIRNAANRLNIPIDRINDPNGTGLIGLQYSPITTERGDLTAKLTSTNPNFAALMIELLKNSGVKENDIVAVSFTGSFPALNIAVLSAVQILKLKPVIITSVGASMWGANYPGLTYLDMEKELYDLGYTNYKSAAASFGGEDDVGRGLSPEGREMLESAITRNNIPRLEIGDVNNVVEKRIAKYEEHGRLKLFINVGGGFAAIGGVDARSGYIRPHEIKAGQNLVAYFSHAGVGVINLNDLNHLVGIYRLPIAPIPIPLVGDGPVYYEMRYSVAQAIIYLSILIVILFFVLRFDIDYYLKRLFKVANNSAMH